mgnify:CR=1 FL=1
MKLGYFFICFSLIIMLSCRSSKPKFTDKQIKTLEGLIENKTFTFKSDWAYPQVTYAMQQVLNSGILQPASNASAISLIGNSNFLTINGDSISSYLPYFGERQMNVKYGGGDSAIQLTGIMEDYNVSKGKRHSYDLKLKAKSKSENYQIYIKIFPNLKTDLQILSGTRFPISYSGQIKPIKE